MQTHALADPRVEADVATALEILAHECPECYFASREPKAVEGEPWPVRTRYETKAEGPCRKCGRQTIWCSAGEWRAGASKKHAVA